MHGQKNGLLLWLTMMRECEGSMTMRITFTYYPGGKKKALTLSYDDGQVHDRRLVEIMNRYGVRGTFHLNSGKFNAEPFLSSDEIAGLFKGHEVSIHTVTHPHLTMVPKEMLVEEVWEDKRNLEDLVGYPVRGMSYPYGTYNEDVIKALPLLGIEYSRTVKSHGSFSLPENFLAWHPTCHHRQNMLDKAVEFQNTKPTAAMPLFYVWGHSFEFDREGNWDLMEEFCKRVSGDENVWYATNIEILDYVTALRNLKFSADKKMVMNTASIPLWIGVDGEPVEIGAGKTVRL